MKVLLETDWKWLIRLYQGKRRVSSKADPGTKACFDTVTNTLSGWISTIRYQRKWRFDYVVVTHTKAKYGDDYASEMQAKAQAEKEQKKRDEVIAELPDLQRQRDEARASRNFELADALRTRIEATGIVVNDKKVQ